MSFQILNGGNEPMTMHQLDAEAAAFWGKRVDAKQYADPSEPKREDEKEAQYCLRCITGNWFDIIG
jgi:hypothetical protein